MTYAITFTTTHSLAQTMSEELESLAEKSLLSNVGEEEGLSYTLFEHGLAGGDASTLLPLDYDANPNAQPSPDSLWDVTIYLPNSYLKAVENYLKGHKSQCQNFNITLVDETVNWLETSYSGFPPFKVGNFFVHGAHVQDMPGDGSIPLCIEAATAFGSGEHPTTQGCLLTLQDLAKEGFVPSSVLDLGCGSGILGIAARHLWPNAHVMCADNDPEAVRKTLHFAALNDVDGSQFSVMCSEGFKDIVRPGVTTGFDLIIANILANPLIELAPDCKAHLNPAGRLVLSGLLTRQASSVLAAYEPLPALDHRNLGEWSTLLLG